MDAAHAEHVLTLQIRAVAPAVHLHHQLVFSLTNYGGEVELTDVVGSLGVTHELTVQPYLCCRINSVEMDDDALSLPRRGQGEGAAIGSYGVDGIVLTAIVVTRICLDEGRRVAVGVCHVAVDGFVIALHFPTAGYGNLVPLTGLTVDGVTQGWTVHHLLTADGIDGWFGGEEELPLSVETLVE